MKPVGDIKSPKKRKLPAKCCRRGIVSNLNENKRKTPQRKLSKDGEMISPSESGAAAAEFSHFFKRHGSSGDDVFAADHVSQGFACSD